MNDYSSFGIQISGSGTQVYTLCPKCSHTRSKEGQRLKCLSVNTVAGEWKCHHCYQAGSLRVGWFDDERSAGRRRPSIRIHADATGERKLLGWFHQRGISEEVVRRAGIAPVKHYFPAIGEADAIAFPYYKDGEVVAVKYRSFEGKYFSQEKGGLKTLYGMDGLTEAEGVSVVVEGELDQLSLTSAGIRGGVSLQDGAPNPGTKADGKFDCLVACREQLERLDRIIIAVDNDGPGKTAEAELIRRLWPERCWRVTWPEGCKDANDVLVKLGADALKHCIESAKPVPVEGIFTGDDIADDVVRLYQTGFSTGISTGLPGLDQYYMPRTGEWSTIIGIPGRGKTTFIESLLVSIAKKHGWRFGVCSPESLPVERHAARFIEKYVGAPFVWRDGKRMSETQMMHGLEWINDHFYTIAPEEMVSVEKVLKYATMLVTRYGIRGLLLDPWNEFEKQRPTSEREDEYLGRVLAKITRWCRTYDVHVWVVAHPKNMDKDKTTGKYPVVRPYDINGGAMFHNKSFNILSVHRDYEDTFNMVEVHSQKAKYWGETGRPGMVRLVFDPVTSQYSLGQQ